MEQERTYQEFLNSKIEIAPDTGFTVRPEDVNPALKPPHTADGKWRKLPEIRNHKVTHWMPMPGPKEE